MLFPAVPTWALRVQRLLRAPYVRDIELGSSCAQGSSQELKAAYGTGYLIQVRFNDDADPMQYSTQLAAVLRQLSPALKVEDSSTRAFRFEVNPPPATSPRFSLPPSPCFLTPLVLVALSQPRH
jgi:hypothetical protein